MPQALKAWLDSATAIVMAAREGKIKQHPLLKIIWQDYISGQITLHKSSTKTIGPLLSTTWNQGKYYNAMCPVDASGPDGHVWTGCVATAMAQVLRYWSYPIYGNSEHSYTHSTYGEQYADFAHTRYYWDSMPNTLTNYNDYVAQLMYHCGVAVNMNYSPSGSGAFMSTARIAMINYFDYSRSATLTYKSYYGERAWDSLIMDQISKQMPVLYSGYGSGGHAFVVDGYEPNDTTFHINWGWGGTYNGWYRLDDLTPGSYDFNSGQQAIVNLFPETGDTIYTVMTSPTSTITDNGGYYFYKNNSLNKWLISPPEAQGILIEFNSFVLVPGQDTLYVYAGVDETAQLFAAYSQDTLPDDLFVPAGTVLLKFVSGQYNAEQGFSLRYNAKARDAGATYIETPYGFDACGGVREVKTYIQNFGYETIDTLAIKVVIEGNTVFTIYDTLLANLAYNEVDSFVVATYDFAQPGEYTIRVITQLAGDMDANNDTATTFFKVNPPLSYINENFDGLEYENFNQHWYDTKYRIWLDGSNETGTRNINKYLTAYINNYDTTQFYFQHKISNISKKTFLSFDYRVLDRQAWPPGAAQIDDSSWIAVLISDNCADLFDTLFVIDANNYVPDTNFVQVFVPLDLYQGQDIIISFSGFWNVGYVYLNLDNFVVTDSLSDNDLISYTCRSDSITLQASNVSGGVDPLLFIWQQSTDLLQWTTVDTFSTSDGLVVAIPEDVVYFRRVVIDSIGMKDTSNILQVDPQDCFTTYLEVYPNPSQGHFVVTNLKPGTVQLVDLSGRLIVNRQVGYSDEEFDLDGLQPGVYILRYIAGGRTMIKKIIIR